MDLVKGRGQNFQGSRGVQGQNGEGTLIGLVQTKGTVEIRKHGKINMKEKWTVQVVSVSKVDVHIYRVKRVVRIGIQSKLNDLEDLKGRRNKNRGQYKTSYHFF